MVLFGAYELYRWQPNMLRSTGPQPFRTLMVSRLDGPDDTIARGLVDKALAAEAQGLKGTAYIDSRGLFGKDPYSRYDQYLRDLALLIQLRTPLAVKEERTAALFEPGSCPDTAIYCGWYSVSKYVDAFEFAPGAVGFHIASFEAGGLHDPNSTQWCPAMLARGSPRPSVPWPSPIFTAFRRPRRSSQSCLTAAVWSRPSTAPTPSTPGNWCSSATRSTGRSRRYVGRITIRPSCLRPASIEVQATRTPR
jgi:hypothetical protein